LSEMHYAVDLKVKLVLYCFIKILYAAKPWKILGCKIVRTKKCSHQM